MAEDGTEKITTSESLKKHRDYRTKSCLHRISKIKISGNAIRMNFTFFQLMIFQSVLALYFNLFNAY